MATATTDFLADLITQTRAQSSITSLLGAATNVWPERGHVGKAKPWLIVEIDDDPSHHHLTGVSPLRMPSVTFVACGDTVIATSRLADAVEAWFDGFRGDLGDQSIRGAFKRDRRLVKFPPSDGSDKWTFEIEVEFELGRAT